MTYQAALRSSVPGRVRLSLCPKAKDSAVHLPTIAARIAAMNKVKEVSANELTQSLLIFHNTTEAELISQLRQHGIETQLRSDSFASRAAPSQRLARRFKASWNALDRRLIDASDRQLDLGVVTFAGLASVGIGQVLRGKFLPAGLTMMLMAFGNMPEVKLDP